MLASRGSRPRLTWCLSRTRSRLSARLLPRLCVARARQSASAMDKPSRAPHAATASTLSLLHPNQARHHLPRRAPPLRLPFSGHRSRHSAVAAVTAAGALLLAWPAGHKPPRAELGSPEGAHGPLVPPHHFPRRRRGSSGRQTASSCAALQKFASGTSP